MKIRRGSGEDAGKVDIQMAPMIDVVFQLLIFFMLTLKIVAPEGDFNINMPIGSAAAASDEPPPLDIKVRLLANPDGTLGQVVFGNRPLGNDAPACFDRLNLEIVGLVGSGGGFADDMSVEIDADYNLNYEYTIKAISSCTGRIDPVTQQPVRYIEKIKLAPPRRPGEA
ncbi:biopolymer transporter ExbD [Maioricimonas sp. JC845]|uniref:ExbD/TolR family protein n=1 Tax=Maioricimonas sp. JC845 TaxID=3232138 RepID=UPI0034591BD3